MIDARVKVITRLRQRIAMLASTLLLAAGAAAADLSIPLVSAADSISVEQLETAINAVMAREGLSAETRNAIVDRLRDAQALLQNRESSESMAEAFANALETAPAETQALRLQLDQAADPQPSADSLGIGDDTPVDEIERLLSGKATEINPRGDCIAD
jgi:potassium efflux system protein